jgi:transposase-like protein
MATEKKVNYTDEQTAEIVKMYTEGNSVDEIAKATGRATRSVRAKLVREGVYQAPEKVVKAKVDGPGKKELLRDLAAIAPNLPIDGFVNATKEAITALIQHLQTEAEAPAEDAGESMQEAA